MLFNSIDFLFFFLCVYLVYLYLGHKAQNRMLLVSSYLFYGSWNWKFLSLILISTGVDYFCGKEIFRRINCNQRRFFLLISILTNLGILGFFKYYNFFSESLASLLGTMGWHMNFTTLNVILPVGISFYTFQTMSYSIDIYRGKIKPEYNVFDFALYVAYFPQLVAGPIERAKRLLPQLINPRTISKEDISEGLWLIVFGYFQKVFIADNLAKIVDTAFSASAVLSGIEYLVAVYAFAFQIFCDFAGYSSIAIGISRLMGIRLMTNFLYPYFTTNPRDFWRNWHISLSTWLRDYLYIPLGGNRKSKLNMYRNMMITMVLGGLWHGAAWTYVIWGFYHGILLVIHRFIKDHVLFQLPQGLKKDLLTFVKVIIMFHLACLGWLFFRAQSLSQAWQILYSMMTNFYYPGVPVVYSFYQIIFYTWLLLFIQMIQKIRDHEMGILHLPLQWRSCLIVGVLFSIIIFGEFKSEAFIYFQF
ncbi:MAG: hypothetical protein AMK70_03500 [Nitrospira bacterium SG8_35_1]|nr:MAG: hypothetical protein AMK70_03500 [Nitrospira bacterium SG8_35_1]